MFILAHSTMNGKCLLCHLQTTISLWLRENSVLSRPEAQRTFGYVSIGSLKKRCLQPATVETIKGLHLHGQNDHVIAHIMQPSLNNIGVLIVEELGKNSFILENELA